MKCDCCGKRKRLFESYEELSFEKSKMHLCVGCSKELYKMRDFYNDNNVKEYTICKGKVDKKSQKCTPVFSKWYNGFIQKQ